MISPVRNGNFPVASLWIWIFVVTAISKMLYQNAWNYQKDYASVCVCLCDICVIYIGLNKWQQKRDREIINSYAWYSCLFCSLLFWCVFSLYFFGLKSLHCELRFNVRVRVCKWFCMECVCVRVAYTLLSTYCGIVGAHCGFVYDILSSTSIVFHFVLSFDDFVSSPSSSTSYANDICCYNRICNWRLPSLYSWRKRFFFPHL